MRTSESNPHPVRGDRRRPGPAEDVGTAWDRDNAGWWHWYMSLADSGSDTSPLVDPAVHDAGPLPTYDEVVAELEQAYPVPHEASSGCPV